MTSPVTEETRSAGGEKKGETAGPERRAVAAGELLEIVRQVAQDLAPRRRLAVRVDLDSRLDRDLGFDSLARAELLLRLQRSFEVELPESLLGEAETPRDLIEAVAAAAGRAVLERGAAAPLAVGPPLEAPAAANTLVEALDWHASQHPGRTHVALLEAGSEQPLSYADLAADARAVARGLRARGVKEGEAVAIMLPTGHDFFRAFLGALVAGAVPVPIYPPLRLSQIEDHLHRQAGILRNAGAAMLISAPEARRVATLLRALVAGLRGVESVASLRSPGEGPPVRLRADDTALLQYTSGSTGDPKGVVLSHRNLLANLRAMGEVMQVTSRDVFVSWLPLYHDMGLIGAWLGSLYYAVPLVLMSPATFLARPASWLWAIHRHRGTLSAAPNFAFELCLHKVDDDELVGLDLSSLRVVANGAEPVRASTVREFSARFASCGFRPSAMAPVYGLAESAVGLAFPPPGRPPVIDRVGRRALGARGEAMLAPPEDRGAVELVSCGQPLPGHQIRIVDRNGREVAERREGRVQFRGPSATAGYFRNPAKTRQLFAGAWLETGDLGYIAGGELYLTGRVKDLVIRAGRNIYPQEVEEAVAAVPGIRKGCVAVFGRFDPQSGTERVVVVAETRETDPERRHELERAAREAAGALLDGPPDEVVLAPPHSVLKTSSGKIRRSASRELYERGAVGAPGRGVARQLAALALAALVGRARGGLRSAGDVLWAAYWWSVIGAAVAVAWTATVLLPRREWRWPAVRRLCRLALRLAGTPLEIEGLPNVPAGPSVVVANHASYLDGPVLAAALPWPLTFVAKEELAGQLFAGLLLRRLGTVFVERFRGGRSVEDLERAVAAARGGGRLVFFPEGTLTRRPGLLAFHLGAFETASVAGLPVVPVAIRGTRSVLRGDQWFPRRGGVRIAVAAPLMPRGDGWHEAVRLRDAARREILGRCGEPDLGEMPLPESVAGGGGEAS